MKKWMAMLLVCGLLLAGLTGCGEKKTPNPVVTITMEDGGVITMELYPDKAPNTVANFIKLIQDGFYDGKIFHRVQAGSLIQGGDPEGNGSGGPGYQIKGEFANNGYAKNDVKFTRGVLGMARSGWTDEETGQEYGMDTAGSQFFITLRETSYWNGQYAAFGKVTKGLDVVERIAKAEVQGGSSNPSAEKPLQEQKIRSMTVDTKGVTYGTPSTLPTVTTTEATTTGSTEATTTAATAAE